MSNGLLRGAAAEDPARRLGGLNEPLNLDTLFADCTCVEANIHFPVDWVLLRDAVRTLVQAIQLIRREGLKKRMPKPSDFLRRINTLAMEMSAVRRSPLMIAQAEPTAASVAPACSSHSQPGSSGAGSHRPKVRSGPP